MPVTELVTTVTGTYAGRAVHEPTGKKGNTFNHVNGKWGQVLDRESASQHSTAASTVPG